MLCSLPCSLEPVEVHGAVPISLGLSVFLSCFSIRGSKWSFCFRLLFLWEMLKKGSNCSGAASPGNQMADEGPGGDSGARSWWLAGCTLEFLVICKIWTSCLPTSLQGSRFAVSRSPGSRGIRFTLLALPTIAPVYDIWQALSIVF